MLIRILKKYQPINLIIFLAISIIAWIKPLLNSKYPGLYIDPDPMPFYGIIMQMLSAAKFSFLCKLIAFIMVVLQGFIINGILNQNNLLGFRGYLPGIIFILLSSTFTDFQLLHPILIANFFLLFAWNRIIRIQDKENPFEAYFNASFLIGLASLFYPNSIFFLIILFLSVGLNRVGHAREFGMVFAGFIAVWYFYLSLYFLFTSTLNFTGIDYTLSFSFPKYPNVFLTQKIIIVIIILLLIASSVQLVSFMSNIKIPMRRNLKYLFLWFWVGIFLILFTKSSVEIIYICSIPISVLFTLFFVNLKKNLASEIIWGVFIIFIILNQTFPNLFLF